MSNPSQKTDSPIWPLAVAIIGVFAIFLVIMALARTPVTPLTQATNVPESEQWKLTEDGRKGRLKELRGAADAKADSYAWINQEEGVVQLPVDRAIELTLADINATR
ncbi:hypothetical protein [Actomonas aquatica]|uniref:Uncharacterized protein n=1 Tax=Actomonas aquatica TaxID=2866162 RepID=A0ABZ1CCD1_9BACT|nr:hypothetical protein [Opitutus sp. WL0086]WRQ88972.1 hypothetical protein K1X11_006105 [Opitutus sp. WL0086]